MEEFEEYRMGHLVRTADLWRQLVELGVTEDTMLSFEFTFIVPKDSSSNALLEALSDYPLEVVPAEDPEEHTYIRGESGPITWSEEQLLKWVDYLVWVGQETGVEFDGCGTSVQESSERASP